MKTAIPLFLVLVSPAILSGCTQGIVGENPWLAHAFEAVYVDESGRRLLVELADGREIRTANRSLVDAYRLRVEVEDSNGDTVRQFGPVWLDQSLRVLRFDRPCVGRPGEHQCDYYAADWMPSGLLPMTGVGLDLWATTGFGRTDPASYVYEISDIVPTTDEGRQVVVNANWTGSGTLAAGRYAFDGIHVFPIKMELSSGDTWTLDSVVHGDELAVDPIPPLVPQVVASSTPVQLFRGERHLILEGEKTAVEVFDWLENESAEFADLREDEGCLVAFAVRDLPNPNTMALGLYESYVTDFTVAAIDDEGTEHEWVVNHERGTAGSMMRIEDTSSRSAPTSCSDLSESPDPSVDAVGVAERYRSTLNASDSHLWSFRVFSGQNPQAWWPATYGWYYYSLAYVPGFIDTSTGGYSFNPYNVMVSGNTGKILHLMGAPEDIDTYDSA